MSRHLDLIYHRSLRIVSQNAVGGYLRLVTIGILIFILMMMSSTNWVMPRKKDRKISRNWIFSKKNWKNINRPRILRRLSTNILLKQNRIHQFPTSKLMASSRQSLSNKHSGKLFLKWMNKTWLKRNSMIPKYQCLLRILHPPKLTKRRKRRHQWTREYRRE